MARVTRALFGTSVLFGRIARVFEAAAAGTLTRADLRAGITREFDRFNDRPELSGLLSWEQEVFDAVLRPGDAVLLVGSGTGREAAALSERGYRVTGIEPSETALAIAQRFLTQRQLSVTLLHGFFEDVAVPGAFDVCVFSYCCYAFIQGSENRVAALRKAAASLRPGGRIIVSCRPGRAMQPALLRIMRAMAALTGSDLRVAPGDDFYRVSAAPPYFGYEHHFPAGELEQEVEAAELRILRRFDPECSVVVLGA